ncbi:MAG: hypothetical protein WCK39_05750 [Methanomassiliicoccales archaeon]
MLLEIIACGRATGNAAASTGAPANRIFVSGAMSQVLKGIATTFITLRLHGHRHIFPFIGLLESGVDFPVSKSPK